MHTPCANQSCTGTVSESRAHRVGRTGLCRRCRNHWINRGLPLGGFLPTGAMRAVARELLADIKPTEGELRDALRVARGTRHREGDWGQRPLYSYGLLLTRPKVHYLRRLPHLLVGRRKPPDALSIMAALCQYHVAINHLGVGPRYARYLLGASYMLRRSLCRPTGELGTFNGRPTRSNYRICSSEFVFIGTHLLNHAAPLLSFDRRRGQDATVRYLKGVETGEFHRSVIVTFASQPTTGPGDSPLDHFVEDRPHWCPQHGHALRRASGLVHGEWPEGLDVPLIERTPSRLNQLRFDAMKPAIAQTPDTGWLFG